MNLLWAYIICRDKAEALHIGKSLVEARLAACVQVMEGIDSIYWWKGELTHDRESVLIAKTSEAHSKALTEKVKLLHSYEIPCVLLLPVAGGHEAYIHWAMQELAPLSELP